MAKIELDKYYTPTDLAEYCINKTRAVLRGEKVTSIIEPSAGAGAFTKLLPANITTSYDIAPERDGIVEQDYLSLELPYERGRLIIGNPPYGRGNYLSVKFYKKAITQGDFISFILPISQLKNNMYMYEFDLVHSEDLGKKIYSGVKVHCCLNIYKRNDKGLNAKPNFDLNDVVLRGVATGKSRNDKIPEKYNFSICGFGSSVGKFSDKEGQYCQQIYFTIKDEFADKVTKVIVDADWKSMYSMTASPKLKHWMISKYLKEQIPELN